MYLACYNIAKDFFPFGSGLGTFASLASITNGYSDIHFQYGVAYIGANSPQDVLDHNHTLLDTFWPHIFGELGFLGSLLYLFMWFYPCRLAYKTFRNTSVPFLKAISFYLFAVIIVMTWEGFSLYTPEIPSFIMFHSGIGGLCFYHLNKNKINIYKK
jgi:hypothetical protein